MIGRFHIVMLPDVQKVGSEVHLRQGANALLEKPDVRKKMKRTGDALARNRRDAGSTISDSSNLQSESSCNDDFAEPAPIGP